MFVYSCSPYPQVHNTELGFQANDFIMVCDVSDEDWWLGYVKNDETRTIGFFPSSFVRLLGKESGMTEGSI